MEAVIVLIMEHKSTQYSQRWWLILS